MKLKILSLITLCLATNSVYAATMMFDSSLKSLSALRSTSATELEYIEIRDSWLRALDQKAGNTDLLASAQKMQKGACDFMTFISTKSVEESSEIQNALGNIDDSRVQGECPDGLFGGDAAVLVTTDIQDKTGVQVDGEKSPEDLWSAFQFQAQNDDSLNHYMRSLFGSAQDSSDPALHVGGLDSGVLDTFINSVSFDGGTGEKFVSNGSGSGEKFLSEAQVNNIENTGEGFAPSTTVAQAPSSGASGPLVGLGGEVESYAPSSGVGVSLNNSRVGGSKERSVPEHTGAKGFRHDLGARPATRAVASVPSVASGPQQPQPVLENPKVDHSSGSDEEQPQVKTGTTVADTKTTPQTTSVEGINALEEDVRERVRLLAESYNESPSSNEIISKDDVRYFLKGFAAEHKVDINNINPSELKGIEERIFSQVKSASTAVDQASNDSSENAADSNQDNVDAKAMDATEARATVGDEQVETELALPELVAPGNDPDSSTAAAITTATISCGSGDGATTHQNVDISLFKKHAQMLGLKGEAYNSCLDNLAGVSKSTCTDKSSPIDDLKSALIGIEDASYSAYSCLALSMAFTQGVCDSGKPKMDWSSYAKVATAVEIGGEGLDNFKSAHNFALPGCNLNSYASSSCSFSMFKSIPRTSWKLFDHHVKSRFTLDSRDNFLAETRRVWASAAPSACANSQEARAFAQERMAHLASANHACVECHKTENVLDLAEKLGLRGAKAAKLGPKERRLSELFMKEVNLAWGTNSESKHSN